jgi:cytoskeletal protein CcmA (bactofilin family)
MRVLCSPRNLFGPKQSNPSYPHIQRKEEPVSMFGKEGSPTTARPEIRNSSLAASDSTALSVIANGMRIVGDIESSGVVKIDGRIEGSVTHARQVLLGRGATVKGNVAADEVVIGGVVDGGIRASERLELQATAVVNGDIETKSIVVLEGARINGAVRMTDLAAPRAEGQKVISEPLRIVTGS